MADRFVAIRGIVYDQTTLPARPLHMDDAKALAKVWEAEVEKCRLAGQYEVMRVWRIPADQLKTAIEAALNQRRMMGANFRESQG